MVFCLSEPMPHDHACSPACIAMQCRKPVALLRGDKGPAYHFDAAFPPGRNVSVDQTESGKRAREDEIGAEAKRVRSGDANAYLKKLLDEESKIAPFASVR